MECDSSSDNEHDCVVCWQLAQDTHSCNSCGGLICGKCAKKKPIQQVCPKCRSENAISPNPAMKQQIGRTKIKCKCGKKVRRDDMPIHLKQYC